MKTEQKKSALVGERNINYKKGIKCNSDYTTEYVGMGISYLGKGNFSIPKMSGKFVSGFEEVALKAKDGKFKCQNALRASLERWVYTKLTPSQETVMKYIFNRTIGFFKVFEVIPQSHFLNGVFNVDEGCDIKWKTNLSRTIKQLLQKGLIKREKHGKVIRKDSVSFGTVYMLDFDAMNQWVKETSGGLKMNNIVPMDFTEEADDYDFSDNLSTLKVITKGLSNIQPKGYQSDNQTVINVITHNTNKEHLVKTLINNNSELPPSNEVGSLFISTSKKEVYPYGDTPPTLPFPRKGRKATKQSETSIERRERILSRTSAYIEDGQTMRVSSPKAVEFFSLLAREQYPNRIYAYPAKKVMGQLKRAIQNTEFPQGDFLDFLEFAVSKWDTIKVQHFEYINRGREQKGQPEIQYPEFPDLGFILTFKKNFLSAFQKDLNSRLSSADLFADRLRAKGMGEAAVQELTTKKMQSDCDYDKARADYHQGLKNLEEEKERLEMQRRSIQKELQQARNSIYLLKQESDKEEKRLASLRASEMPQKAFSIIEPVSQVKTDWNGMSVSEMQSCALSWIEKYIPDYAYYTEELFQEVFMKEFKAKKGDLSFVYSSMTFDNGSYYDRRMDLLKFDKECAILEASGDQEGIKDLKEFFAEELTPGFKRFSESE
jgi:hypothetical protein